MKNWFKKLLIPSGEKTEVIAYNSWVVRWRSADCGVSIAYPKDQAEIFPSERDAEAFARSLREARELLKDRGFSVVVQANQSKLATLQQ